MSSCSGDSEYTIPVLCQTECDDLLKVQEAADKALKNIQSIYNEIMTPKSYSDLEDEFGDILLSHSTTISTIPKENQRCDQDSKSKRKSDLCNSCQKYISYCTSCKNRLKNNESNRGVTIQNNLLHTFSRYRNETSPKFNITVPQPFSLTAENAKRQEAKAIKIAKLKEQLTKESEKELNVRIRSQPVPNHIRLPLYEEMTKQSIERKLKRKEKCQEMLEKETKPFTLSFSAKKNSKSVNDLTKDSVPFKARPAPKNILSENVSKRIRDKEELRKILITHRAEEMLKQSSLPFSSKKISRSYSMSNLSSQKELNNKLPKPNIDAITKRLYTIKCKETMDSWNSKVLEQNSKAIVYKDCNKSKMLPEYALPFYNFPVRMSTAALLRENQIRTELSLRKLKEKQEEITKEEMVRKRREFLKIIGPRLKSVEPLINSHKEIEEKVKDFRESQRIRACEYEKELEEMMNRVSKQCLLIERQSKDRKQTLQRVAAKSKEEESEKQLTNEDVSEKQSTNEDASENQSTNDDVSENQLTNAESNQLSIEGNSKKELTNEEDSENQPFSANEELEEIESPSERSEKSDS